MSNKFFGAIGVSGGSDGFLDNIDGGNLSDLDGAFALDSTDKIGVFWLDSDYASTSPPGTQVIPTVMQPDANAGNKRWLMLGANLVGLSLYEAGTTNKVNFSQSSGNLTIDNTYDTGTITIKGENSGDATLMVLDPAGSVDLYYANSKKFETVTGGISITGSCDVTVDFTVGDTVITDGVITDSTGFQITGGTVTLSGSGETLAVFTDDGSVDLYYDNTAIFSTASDGVAITDGTATAAKLRFSGDNLVIDNNEAGGLVSLVAEKAATGQSTLFQGNPDGATELYYNGTKKCETAGSGLLVYDSDASDNLYLYHSGTVAILQNYTHGGGVQLSGENASGDAKYIVVGDPDDAVELYYAGTKVFETRAGGISLYDGSGSQTHIVADSTDTRIYSGAHGLPVSIQGENASGSGKYMFKADPDGEAELYYAGTKMFQTNSLGIQVLSNSNTMALQSSGSGFEIYSYDHGNPFSIKCENASGASKTIFKGDPDGAAELYYDGNRTMDTISSGIRVTRGGTSYHCQIYNQSSGDATWHNLTVSAPVKILGTDSGSNTDSIFIGDPDGEAELYYAGVKAFETRDPGGFNLYNTTSPTFQAAMWVGTDGNVKLKHYQSSKYFEIIDTSNYPHVRCHEGADVELYYNNLKCIETTVVNDKRGIAMNSGAVIVSGNGSPNSVVSAPVGSIFLRADGGTSTSMYVKESGTGNTGWVAK